MGVARLLTNFLYNVGVLSAPQRLTTSPLGTKFPKTLGIRDKLINISGQLIVGYCACILKVHFTFLDIHGLATLLVKGSVGQACKSGEGS